MTIGEWKRDRLAEEDMEAAMDIQISMPGARRNRRDQKSEINEQIQKIIRDECKPETRLSQILRECTPKKDNGPSPQKGRKKIKSPDRFGAGNAKPDCFAQFLGEQGGSQITKICEKVLLEDDQMVKNQTKKLGRWSIRTKLDDRAIAHHIFENKLYFSGPPNKKGMGAWLGAERVRKMRMALGDDTARYGKHDVWNRAIAKIEDRTGRSATPPKNKIPEKTTIEPPVPVSLETRKKNALQGLHIRVPKVSFS